MAKAHGVTAFLPFFLIFLCGCSIGNNNEQNLNNQDLSEVNLDAEQRADGAYLVNIDTAGSLQNPAWSPDGKAIVFTNWQGGYNLGPSDLMIFDLEKETPFALVSDGQDNINLPGSAWNPVTNQIVFASTRGDHDEIYLISADGSPGNEIQITKREGLVAYEPSFSPDGESVVFESHILDIEGNGVIFKFAIDGSEPYTPLTDLDNDCRQPNWSPAGDLILYQKLISGEWEIFIMDTNGANGWQVTSGPGSKTDASFSPDGEWIIFSYESEDIEFANLFAVSVLDGELVRITDNPSYDGAASWSPDSRWIAFESSAGDPDELGTQIWIIASNLFQTSEKDWYQPMADATWQWQLSGRINTEYDVDIYDIDLFDSSAALISELQSAGKKVICYFSGGSYENWRSDANQFDEAALGKTLSGWEDERWLDIRSPNVYQVMLARLDLAQQKGCDGVEPDNMDGYVNNSGFDLSAADQLEFNRFIADEAHKRKLAVGLKNNLDQIIELVDYFDFSVNEQCHEFEECDALRPFIAANKPVFNVEYDVDYLEDIDALQEMCADTIARGFKTLILPLELDDSFRISCDEN